MCVFKCPATSKQKKKHFLPEKNKKYKKNPVAYYETWWIQMNVHVVCVRIAGSIEWFAVFWKKKKKTFSTRKKIKNRSLNHMFLYQCSLPLAASSHTFCVFLCFTLLELKCSLVTSQCVSKMYAAFGYDSLSFVCVSSRVFWTFFFFYSDAAVPVYYKFSTLSLSWFFFSGGTNLSTKYFIISQFFFLPI